MSMLVKGQSGVWEKRLLFLSAPTLTFSHQCRQEACDLEAETQDWESGVLHGSFVCGVRLWGNQSQVLLFNPR